VIRRARASIRLDARIAVVYGLLADYEQYAEWVPEVSSSRVLDREGDITVAEFSVGSRTLTLEIIASPPYSVEYSTVDELKRRAVSGSWRLSEDEAMGGVNLETRLSVNTGLLDLGSRRRIREGLELALSAVSQQIARIVRHSPPTGFVRRKIMEVVRHSDGLRIWFEGDRYEFRKLPRGAGS
jgi:ribosome-associated toxin RatA of RatAB toxin-antitoxin module